MINALNACAADPRAACCDFGFVAGEHGSRLRKAVWDVCAHALLRFGTLPTLVGWDADLPPLAVLLGEAQTAARPPSSGAVMPTADPAATEALRRQARPASLVTALAAAGAPAGLQACRANAHSSEERALATARPTPHALLGAEAFAQLASGFWHAHPPQCGDLAEWGDGLPDWQKEVAVVRDR